MEFKINIIDMFRIDYSSMKLYSHTVDDAVVMTFTLPVTIHTTIILQFILVLLECLNYRVRLNNRCHPIYLRYHCTAIKTLTSLLY